MKYLNSETRLTDSLERQLIAQAVADQMQFKPIQAIKDLFASIAAKFSKSEHNTVADDSTQVHAAS